jgi:hypothetical protein
MMMLLMMMMMLRTTTTMMMMMMKKMMMMMMTMMMMICQMEVVELMDLDLMRTSLRKINHNLTEAKVGSLSLPLSLSFSVPMSLLPYRGMCLSVSLTVRLCRRVSHRELEIALSGAHGPFVRVSHRYRCVQIRELHTEGCEDILLRTKKVGPRPG